MPENLKGTREDLRSLLKEYSRADRNEKSEEEMFRDEAEYAASGLKSDDTVQRAKAVEFLEILNENPFAQDYLLFALKDKDSSVVQKAIHALGKVATKRSIPDLKKYMEGHKSKHIVAELSKIISKLDRKTES